MSGEGCIAMARHTPPTPLSVICARCESVVLGVDNALPRRWSMVDGQPHCEDCSPAAPDPAQLAALVDPTSKLHEIGPVGHDSRTRGCRIAHEIAFGSVGLRIHAGVGMPSRVRDEPVQFLMTPPDLDQLIDHLTTIREELTATQTGKAA